jgi:hypothetical protein
MELNMLVSWFGRKYGLSLVGFDTIRLPSWSCDGYKGGSVIAAIFTIGLLSPISNRLIALYIRFFSLYIIVMSQTLAPRNADARAVIGRINDQIQPGQPKISSEIAEDGPQQSKLFQCTYYLGNNFIASGEWKPSKAEARLSAAIPSLVLLRTWGYDAA